MVDDLDRDASGFGFGEGAGGIAVQGVPGLGVDLGLEGGFQGLVGIVGSQEVGVANEEAFLVVVRVDEPAGNALGVVAAHLAGGGMEHIHSVDGDLC